MSHPQGDSIHSLRQSYATHLIETRPAPAFRLADLALQRCADCLQRLHYPRSQQRKLITVC